MSKKEKIYCILFLLTMVIYIPCFIFYIGRYSSIIMTIHIVLMFANLIFLILVFRDIYKRDFPNPNTKVTWTLLICLFSPSVFVYLFMHAFKPRQKLPKDQ